MRQTRRVHHRPRQHRPELAALSLGLVCLNLVSACDGEPEDETLRSVEFEGSAVAAEIAADPDATFYVNLDEDIWWSFDQTVAAIDWDHFLVTLDGVDEPVAMPIFAERSGLELNSTESFELFGGSSTDASGFRAEMYPCDYVYCDDYGKCRLVKQWCADHGDNPDDP